MEHFKQMQQSSVFQTWQITPLEGQINIDLPFTCSFMIPLPVWTNAEPVGYYVSHQFNLSMGLRNAFASQL